MPATVEGGDIPPSGAEVRCDHCGFSFRLRPHSPGQADQEGSPRPEEREASDRPSSLDPSAPPLPDPKGLVQGLPIEAILARDEVPYAVVQAHLAAEKRRAPARSTGRSEWDSASQDIRTLQDAAISQQDDMPTDRTMEGPRLEGSSFPLERRSWGWKNRTRVASKRVLGWSLLAVIVLGVAAGLFYFRPLPTIRWEALRAWFGKASAFLPGGKHELGSIQFSDLNSYFVSGGRGQTGAFVIEGNVTNHHPVPCKFVQVKGTLFDAKGDRAAEETAYCGNILKKSEIQNSSAERIREVLQRPSGAALSNLSIEPGKSIPFMLVFLDPPENVSEFSVEIVGYQKETLPEEKEQPLKPAGEAPDHGGS